MIVRTLALVLTLFIAICEASAFHVSTDPFEIRFITPGSVSNPAIQQQLRSSAAWNEFAGAHKGWWVQFNESSGMPHRAFGAPFTVAGTDPAAVAAHFLTNELTAFTENSVLEPMGVVTSQKYYQANYIQKFNGIEVLFSRATVKMDKTFRIAMFGLDIYNDIALNTVPALDPAAGIAAAASGFNGMKWLCSAAPAIKILPIPRNGSYEYRLVYETEITLQSEMHGRYYTLVDAMDGKVLYRSNRVRYMHPGGTSVNVSATIYPTNPYDPAAVMPLQYIKVNSGSIDYTDVNGFLTLPAGTTNATLALEGLFGEVYTGQSGVTVQSFSTPLVTGSNPLSFDPYAGIPHRTAYYHTNVAHDYMKSLLPSFTGLDFPITIRVERTDGTCNAFYDGGINFYTTAGGCNGLSLVGDVVYHEYGHGISDLFYSANGTSFQNGAMGEGYSDVWAISITENPVLGIGFDSSDPAIFVRTYDFENGAIRKVYPQHIMGEVHADGEIICGAWWDVALNLGSVSAMSQIFSESLSGLANGPDGDEGQVYTDILIDALFADDNDANLSNGTPNGPAIYNAFALHGITLLTNSSLTHTPVTTALPGSPVTIDAVLSQINPGFAWAFSGVKCYYALNMDTTWLPFSLTTTNNINYTATIPGQPSGTIIKYFLGIEDINSKLTSVLPPGADAVTEPNIPYFIKTGYDWVMTDDFDATFGPWQAGIASDDATTGMWDLLAPIETEVNGSVVQPGYQVTPTGSLCFVTGNATLGSGAGTNDVDDGKTTLELQGIDLSMYVNPAIEYFRWYSNDQGATPGTDYWQVSISEDGGMTWIPVENTRTADHSWRNFVFRVNDYISNTTNIYMRFVAEDANAGSLVEALLDDFSVYEQGTVGVEESEGATIMLHPNPACDKLYINSGTSKVDRLEILNAAGAVVFTAGNIPAQFQVDVSSFAPGIYCIKTFTGKSTICTKAVISR